MSSLYRIIQRSCSGIGIPSQLTNFMYTYVMLCDVSSKDNLFIIFLSN